MGLDFRFERLKLVGAEQGTVAFCFACKREERRRSFESGEGFKAGSLVFRCKRLESVVEPLLPFTCKREERRTFESGEGLEASTFF